MGMCYGRNWCARCSYGLKRSLRFRLSTNIRTNNNYCVTYFIIQTRGLIVTIKVLCGTLAVLWFGILLIEKANSHDLRYISTFDTFPCDRKYCLSSILFSTVLFSTIFFSIIFLVSFCSIASCLALVVL